MTFWDLGLGAAPPKAVKPRIAGTISVEMLHQMECEACPLKRLWSSLQHPHMEPTGSKKPVIYCIGEAPGETEDREGEQFVGESGQMIRAQIPDKWYDRIRWNNVVRCRPPKNRTPTPVEIECFPEGTLVLPVGRLEKVYRRWYIGDLIKITTASGNVLSGSPNHPIVTKRGSSLALKSIVVGDYVVCTSNGNGHSSWNPNKYYKPTSIDKVFSSLDFIVERIPGIPKNFHGDGMSGDVDIIDVDGFLRNSWHPFVDEEVSQLDFASAYSYFCSFVVYGSFSKHLFRKAKAAWSSVTRSPFFCSMSSVPHLRRLFSGSEGNSFSFQEACDSTLADVYEPTKLTDAYPAEVEFDQVVSVETIRDFSGHLYNLQTSSGYYTANGIKVKNCCRPSVTQDIERTKPVAIFAFGGTPLSWGTGSDGIYRWRGRWLPVRVGSHTCWLFPMLHPAGLLRMRRGPGGKIKSESEHTFIRDLKRAFKLVDKLPPARVLERPDVTKPDAYGIQFVTGGESGDLKKVQKWLDSLHEFPSVALDLETSTEEKLKDRQTRPYGKGAKILTAALATGEICYAFPFRHKEAGWTAKQLSILEQMFVLFLETYKGLKVAHNLSFELEWLAYFHGKDLVYAGRWGDTMGQAYVLDERRGMLGLDDLTLQYFGLDIKTLFQLRKGRLDDEPLEKVLVYNAFDSKYEHLLYRAQLKRLKQEGLLEVYRNHVPPVQASVLTQLFGNKLNFEFIEAKDIEYSDRIEKLAAKIAGSGVVQKYERWKGKPFKPSSHKDVITLFRDFLERPEGKVDADEDRDKTRHRGVARGASRLADDKPEKSGGKTYSADDSVLRRIELDPDPGFQPLPLAGYIREYRAVAGNKSKYIDPVKPEAEECVFPDNRIHPNLHIFFTDSGRTSSSFPNEQYWPKKEEEFRELRAEFVAEEDCYVVAIDQGQIEARTIQMAARDKRYGEYLWDRHDVHMDWTKRLAYAYPRRVGGKKFIKDPDVLKKFRHDVKNQWTFPLFFGCNAYSASRYLSMPIDVIDPLVDQFWDEFSGVKAWQEELEDFYRKHGYVECLTGRRRRAPITHNELINSPIQGTASDITVSAWCRLSQAACELDMWQFQARLEVHDELVFHLPKKTFDRDIEFVAGYLLETSHFDFINVPLSIEISRGPDWYRQEPLMTLYSDDLGLIDRKRRHNVN